MRRGGHPYQEALVQINALTAAPSLRNFAKLPEVAPASAGPVDGYAGTIPALGSQAGEVPEGSGIRAAHLGQKVALAALAGLSLFGALAAPAMAGEGTPPQISSTMDEDIAQARRYGLSEQTIEKIQGRPEVVASLKSIPPDISSMYRGLSANQRRVAFEEITGSSRVGPFKISHRKAFVEAKVMGMDPLPQMQDGIDKRVDKGDLTTEEGAQLKSALGRLIRLERDQREAIATVIELEGPGR